MHSCCGILFCDEWIYAKENLLKIQFCKCFWKWVWIKKEIHLPPSPHSRPPGPASPASPTPFSPSSGWWVGPTCQLLLPPTAPSVSLALEAATGADPRSPRPLSPSSPLHRSCSQVHREKHHEQRRRSAATRRALSRWFEPSPPPFFALVSSRTSPRSPGPCAASIGGS